MTRARSIGLILLLTVATAGVVFAARGHGDPDEEGLRVYREQYCGTCHAFEAAGTRGAFGPGHDRMGRIAEERVRDPAYTGSATTAEEYLRESLIDPGAYRVPGYETSLRFAMPPYTRLSESDLNALIRLLLDAH